MLFDVFRDKANELDDHLCHLISGCGFGTKYIGLGLYIEVGILAQRIVFRDDMQRV